MALLRDRRLQGWKFRRQHVIGSYIADFYCERARLVIELDGGHHSEERQVQQDLERSRDFLGVGVWVLRFWNSDVMDRRERVLEEILRALTAPPHPASGHPLP